MGIVIREMETSDIEVVKHIAQTSWHFTYEGIIPQEVQNKFLSMAYHTEMLKRRMEKSHFYVAEMDKTVVGFANFLNNNQNEEVELAAIYLLPTAQNKGVGSELLKYGINRLAPTTVTVNVESENKIGKQFYHAKGFQVVEEYEEDFESHQLQTTRMILNITK